MNIPYNPQKPSAVLIKEIKYYMALSALKKMLAGGAIASQNYRKAAVAIAEKYQVLKYDI